MTQNECLEKTGEAYGVIEADGETINYYPTWAEAELKRYVATKSPEEIATLKATRLSALAKARDVRKTKKAEINKRKTTVCKECKYTLSMCICDLKVKPKSDASCSGCRAEISMCTCVRQTSESTKKEA
jgi:hypothetical protein